MPAAVVVKTHNSFISHKNNFSILAKNAAYVNTLVARKTTTSDRLARRMFYYWLFSAS
jgi:hypothetical protein